MNDDKPSGGTDFDNGFASSPSTVTPRTAHLTSRVWRSRWRSMISARKDDVFEIEDREVVIV